MNQDILNYSRSLNERPIAPGLTFTNGVVSFTKDLVFGLCVLGEHGWVPMGSLCRSGFETAVKALDNNPTFPFKSELAELQEKPWDWFCTICDTRVGEPTKVCCGEVQHEEFLVLN